MAYNEFAYFYDEFNGEADYDALYGYITDELKAHGITDGILADLGCGTGDLTLMLTQPGQACGTPAALARNDDVPRADLFGPHRNGLQKPVLGDAVGQLVQRVVVKPLAGLLGVRLDFPQRQR